MSNNGVNQLASIQTEQDGTIDLTQYWRIVRRRKWSIALVTVMFFALGLLVAIKSTPIY